MQEEYTYPFQDVARRVLGDSGAYDALTAIIRELDSLLNPPVAQDPDWQMGEVPLAPGDIQAVQKVLKNFPRGGDATPDAWRFLRETLERWNPMDDPIRRTRGSKIDLGRVRELLSATEDTPEIAAMRERIRRITHAKPRQEGVSLGTPRGWGSNVGDIPENPAYIPSPEKPVPTRAKQVRQMVHGPDTKLPTSAEEIVDIHNDLESAYEEAKKWDDLLAYYEEQAAEQAARVAEKLPPARATVVRGIEDRPRIHGRADYSDFTRAGNPPMETPTRPGSRKLEIHRAEPVPGEPETYLVDAPPPTKPTPSATDPDEVSGVLGYLLDEQKKQKLPRITVENEDDILGFVRSERERALARLAAAKSEIDRLEKTASIGGYDELAKRVESELNKGIAYKAEKALSESTGVLLDHAKIPWSGYRPGRSWDELLQIREAMAKSGAPYYGSSAAAAKISREAGGVKGVKKDSPIYPHTVEGGIARSDYDPWVEVAVPVETSKTRPRPITIERIKRSEHAGGGQSRFPLQPDSAILKTERAKSPIGTIKNYNVHGDERFRTGYTGKERILGDQEISDLTVEVGQKLDEMKDLYAGRLNDLMVAKQRMPTYLQSAYDTEIMNTQRKLRSIQSPKAKDDLLERLFADENLAEEFYAMDMETLDSLMDAGSGIPSHIRDALKDLIE